jgi:hypothetical protein
MSFPIKTCFGVSIWRDFVPAWTARPFEDPMRERFLAAIAVGALLSVAPTIGADAAPDPAATRYSSGKMPRDPMLAQAKPLGRYRGFLRVSVDLSAKMPPVGDQGQLPSSMAWAMAYAARAYYAASEDSRNPADPRNEASPGYVYHLARESGCADGVTPTEVAAVLQRGALSLADYPYSAACAPPAPPALVAAAHDFKVGGIAVVDPARVDDIKAQVERGNPVVVGFRDGSRFQAFRGDGVFDEPGFDSDKEEEAYQALTVVGYDDRRQAVRVMNSWGKGWGDAGYAWIGYGTLASRASFALVLSLGAERAPPTPPPTAVSEATPPAATQAPEAPLPDTSALSAPNPFADADMPHGPPVAPPDPPITPIGPGSARVEVPTPKPSAEPPARPSFAMLDSLACGHVSRSRAEGRTVLAGYVATPDDLALVKSVAASEPNTRLGTVVVAPWPQCEALETLAKPLAKAGAPGVTLTPADIATEGDTLRIAIEAPQAPSFLYVSYFQADGTVVTLAQPQAPFSTQTAPGERIVFGDGQSGRPRFTVSAPFGTEMVVVLAAASPLFATPLPAQQSERDYLSALRAALPYKPVASLPDRDVAAAVRSITTRSRSSETAGRSP